MLTRLQAACCLSQQNMDDKQSHLRISIGDFVLRTGPTCRLALSVMIQAESDAEAADLCSCSHCSPQGTCSAQPQCQRCQAASGQCLPLDLSAASPCLCHHLLLRFLEQHKGWVRFEKCITLTGGQTEALELSNRVATMWGSFMTCDINCW